MKRASVAPRAGLPRGDWSPANSRRSPFGTPSREAEKRCVAGSVRDWDYTVTVTSIPRSWHRAFFRSGSRHATFGFTPEDLAECGAYEYRHSFVAQDYR